MTMKQAHPLHWPIGWKRTANPQSSRFGKGYGNQHSVARATRYVHDELRRLGATRAIISTNMELRLDGLPRSGQRKPDDAGVAVYFALEGKEQCIPCDSWNRVADNIWAIYKTIEALRGIERWGAKQMVDAAFRGFKALPAPGDATPRYFDECVDADHARATYRRLCKEKHPDVGGNPEEFSAMMKQYEELKNAI